MKVRLIPAKEFLEKHPLAQKRPLILPVGTILKSFDKLYMLGDELAGMSDSGCGCCSSNYRSSLESGFYSHIGFLNIKVEEA